MSVGVWRVASRSLGDDSRWRHFAGLASSTSILASMPLVNSSICFSILFCISPIGSGGSLEIFLFAGVASCSVADAATTDLGLPRSLAVVAGLG